MDKYEFYLASPWAFTEAGVEHVLEGLASLDLTGANYAYEPDDALFKVRCFHQDCVVIQEKFYKIIDFIEDGIPAYGFIDEILNSSDFIDLIRPYFSRLYTEREIIRKDEAASEEPQFLDAPDIKHTREWTRLQNDHSAVKFDEFASQIQLMAMQDDTGATIEWHPVQRVVQISADSETAVGNAYGRLTVLFEDYIRSPPRTQHLFLAETTKHYGVDARLMREINLDLLVSTLLDSSQVTGLDMYRRIYFGAASLRVCLVGEDGYHKMSMFGPRPKGVFNETQKRWEFAPFIRRTYPSKQTDLASLPLPPAAPSMQRPEAVENTVQEWIDRIPETSSLAMVDRALLAPSPAAPMSITSTAEGHVPVRNEPGEDSPIAIPAWNPRRRDIVSTFQNLSIESAKVQAPEKQVSQVAQNVEPDRQLETSGGIDLLADPVPPKNPPAPSSEVDLIDLGNNPHGSVLEQNITFEMTPLVPVPQIQFRDEISSREFHETMNQQARSRVAGRPSEQGRPSALPVGSGDMPGFIKPAKEAAMDLVGRMRSKAGKVKMRIEFGRIYLVDLPGSCLAINQPHQPASPWEAQDIIRKLNISKDMDIWFTKILSTFGNDAEFIAELKIGGLAMWTPYCLSVLYQFNCTHLGTGENFIIEVDGNTFRWKIRSDAGQYPPVLVHCLQRQWDFRVVVEHTSTDELVSKYGEFAKQLVASLMIPPNTREAPVLLWTEQDGYIATVSHVRVHHLARYRSNDKKTFLDIDQIQRTFIAEERTGHTRHHKAESRPLTKVSNGQVPVWYEASITSAAAEELFLQNEKLQYGQKTAWTETTFRQERVFELMFARAVAMIQRIDGVGVYCDNGLGAQFGVDNNPEGKADASPSVTTSTQAQSQRWEDEAHYW